MRRRTFRVLAVTLAIVLPLPPPLMMAPVAAMAQQESGATTFNAEQLDALLAPIALYPDPLLMQMLMAATYPLQIVEASRWLAQPGNAQLTGDALAKALENQSWDPSVKSLVPFPQVLEMMNSKLDWTQQLGYAFATQQADMMNSIQRLRAQAQQAGHLSSTPQQTVSSDQGAIVIQPADPQVVYVPSYNPTVVYGAWPYPAVPPVYFPPPAGYVAGAFVSGLAFATGAAVVGSLWGWARPAWSGGSVNVNVNRWNNINVNRTAIQSSTWRPPPPGVGGRPIRPPGGPVGAPARLNGLPANAIGRSAVQVPSGLVNRPGSPGGGGNVANRPGGPGGTGGVANRPGGAGGPGNVANRPGGAGGGNVANRPSPPSGTRPGGGPSPGGGLAANRPATLPAHPPQRTAGTGGAAFGGMNQGSRAAQYGARGAQSRSFQRPAGGMGGGARGPAGGGGRRR